MHRHTRPTSREEGQVKPELSSRPNSLVSGDLESDMNKLNVPGVEEGRCVRTEKQEYHQKRRTDRRA